MDFEQRYRAVAARDSRFDGSFITGVRTTGIYCRPSCPAKTPKPANVEFFETSASAHQAGYRACKRCLPDAVPGSPEWNQRGDVAARAMRLIVDGVVERAGVTGLAAQLGYTSRHLNRLLTSELGAGALALARAHRAQVARELLVSTELGVGEVAFAAGFGSIRQFNETIAEVYGRTPTQLRQTRRGGPVPGSTAGEKSRVGIRLALPVRLPYDAEGVFTWLAARAVPGVEEAGPSHYARTLRLPGGAADLDVRWDGTRLLLAANLATLSDLSPLVARVRRLFDADADPVGVDAALAKEPALTKSVRRVPGIRLPGAVDPHELLLRALVGQQISVAAARTQLHRLAEACGTTFAHAGNLTRMFPTPAQVAAHGHGVLTGPKVRLGNIWAITARLADGSLDLSWADDPAEQRARLIAEPGIGEWTADYVAMRVLGHPDLLPTGDVALRHGAANLGLPSRPRELQAWGERVSPWRSYASLHLWRAAKPSKEPE